MSANTRTLTCNCKQRRENQLRFQLPPTIREASWVAKDTSNKMGQCAWTSEQKSLNICLAAFIAIPVVSLSFSQCTHYECIMRFFLSGPKVQHSYNGFLPRISSSSQLDQVKETFICLFSSFTCPSLHLYISWVEKHSVSVILPLEYFFFQRATLPTDCYLCLLPQVLTDDLTSWHPFKKCQHLTSARWTLCLTQFWLMAYSSGHIWLFAFLLIEESNSAGSVEGGRGMCGSVFWFSCYAILVSFSPKEKLE